MQARDNWQIAKPDNVTEKELGIIDMVRRNKAEEPRAIKKKWRIGRLEIQFTWTSRKASWGRFGGGWNWKLGFEAGSWRSVAFLFLICRLSFYLPRPDKGLAK